MSVPNNGPREIQLQSAVKHHFQTFIFGNSTQCDRVVQQDSAKGQRVVICGAGPSLRDHAAEYCPEGDQVWGCNSAATWLHDNGHTVTHGFTVDQTPQMLAEWASVPPIEYLLASSCNPFLAEMLVRAGRAVTFFHNYCGVPGPTVSYNVCGGCRTMFDRAATDPQPACPACQGTTSEGATVMYEEWLYEALYPPTITVGSGLNAVTRAVDLAVYMGFSQITVLGADCYIHATGRLPSGLALGSPGQLAWLRENTVMHANGGHALASDSSCLTLGADICTVPTCGRTHCRHPKRYWLTKPDLAVTAVWLVWMARQYGTRLRLVGDTLPNALLRRPIAYLKRLPMLQHNGRPITFRTHEGTPIAASG
jgi:hypothetical protein